jgi:hypothetical protein
MTQKSRNIVIFATLCSVAWSCKKQDQTAAAGYSQGQAGPYVAQGGAAGMAGGFNQPGMAAAGGMAGGYSNLPAAGAPGAGGTPVQTGRGTAQVLDASAASVVQASLNELARTRVVAGSKPLGGPVVGNFQAGQTLENQITLQPNKCYSVVAVALPPVSELSVQFLAVTLLPALAPVLAQDQDVGPTAVLGKKPNCYGWGFPVPAPVRVVIQVVGGQGLAAAQVYEK